MKLTHSTHTTLARYLLAIFCLLGLVFAQYAHAANRVALVIGNQDYHNDVLETPINDATSVAEKLKKLGFTVIPVGKNLDRRAMLEKVREFRQQINRNTEIALFYYAGHGAQYNNESYLIPLRANLEYANDLPIEAVKAKDILNQIEEQSAKVNVMILDACRNLPLKRANRSNVRGLAPMESHSSTLIAYSTKAGDVAKDKGKSGVNSPYTEVLLDYLDKPNMPLTQLFNDVSYDVYQQYQQEPWTNSSRIPRVYLQEKTTNQVADISPTPVAPKLNIPAVSNSQDFKNWIIKWRNGKAGFVDSEGNVKIDFQYNDINPFTNNGLAIVQKNDKWGYINAQGKVVVPFIYDLVGEFEKNRLAMVKNNNKWGYINTQGKVVIPLHYDDAGAFRNNGLARVRKDNKYGFINAQGKVVIPLQYDGADSFRDNGLARVRKDNKYGFINAQGKIVIALQYDEANSFTHDSLAIVQKDGKYGFINAQGEEIIPLQYGWAGSFRDNGLAGVKKNSSEKWGFVNTQGEEIIPLQYDFVHWFSGNGLAAVEKNGKWGYVDAQGKMVIPLQYDKADSFSDNGLATVEKDGKYGFINAQGEEIIPLQYDFVHWFSGNGLAAVEKNGKWGYLNAHGKVVIPLLFDTADSFRLNGLAIVEKNGKYFYIDEQGNYVKDYR